MGAMLKADNKEKLSTYSPEDDAWDLTERIVGDAVLILKTANHGFPQLHVVPSGFQWEYMESYRSQPNSSFKANLLINSCSSKFTVPEFIKILENQRQAEYKAGGGDGALDCSSFAINLFEAISGKGMVDLSSFNCCDSLNGF